MDNEFPTLMDALANQRHHVQEILDGLPADDLHRPILPTGWSCLGLVQHLAIDVERFWFRDVIGGEDVDYIIAGDPDESAWQVAPEVAPATILDLYRYEIERADAVLATVSLDQEPPNWPTERFPNWKMTTVREVVLHVITETACHAGHLDAARELIDGHTWLILT